MKQKLLERFLRYVKVYTPSDANSGTSPSTPCQFDLAYMLEKEMKAIGICDVYVDENCYVYGSIPASEGCEALLSIGFIAHMDTVSDCCDKPVIPLVHTDYNGEDLSLPEGGTVIRVKDFPHLKQMKGRTLITSDGSTILGADDKAGIAEIMTMAEEITKQGFSHGRICIAFTPDEEIGSGADLLDLQRLGADFAYTADGDLEGTLEYETFNAASAKITVKGINVHPGSAKGIMVNSAAVACELQGMLPPMEQPAFTEGYEGFFHLTYISGEVEKTDMHYIIRDHDRTRFEERKRLILSVCDTLNEKYGKGTVTADISDTYYNMAEILKDHMHLVERAEKAIRLTGLEPHITPVRGGTDGSRLSFRGLPCPNLGTGGAGFHGPYEHISLEGMELAVREMIKIVQG